MAFAVFNTTHALPPHSVVLQTINPTSLLNKATVATEWAREAHITVLQETKLTEKASVDFRADLGPDIRAVLGAPCARHTTNVPLRSNRRRREMRPSRGATAGVAALVKKGVKTVKVIPKTPEEQALYESARYLHITVPVAGSVGCLHVLNYYGYSNARRGYGWEYTTNERSLRPYFTSPNHWATLQSS